MKKITEHISSKMASQFDGLEIKNKRQKKLFANSDDKFHPACALNQKENARN